MTEALPISPQAIAEWMPFAKAAGFFFATFILEDLAAIGAGLLLATGQISWPAAFLACFLGIWMGDAGLYGLARWAGRGWFERSSLRKYSDKVARSEQWFDERGTTILIFSRMIPGARLPTYLAAGFLRVPLPRFLLITGAASCAWTLVVLFLARTFGEPLVKWLSAYKYGSLIALVAAIGLLVTLQLLRRIVREFDFRRAVSRFERWRHWEFWPAWMFYPPVAIYCVWLAIKYRGLMLPTAANPGIFSGGLVGESKHAMLQQLYSTSPQFTAKASLITGQSIAERMQSVEDFCADLALEADTSVLLNFHAELPFILKPDFGQRGVGVKLVRSWKQAESYLSQTSAPLIVQNYASGPHEVGIFYYRFPHEPRGRTFAITEKIFPVLVGDGKSTVAELIEYDPRARFVADTYLKRFQTRRDEVLASGETLKLVEAGNHAQGCIFRDGMRLWSPQLEARIDKISQKLDGFCVGRYDIRFASEDDLKAGRSFQIIELNGAASEATNIYDARNSLWSAYRTLFKQWDLVFAIGAANRARGVAPTKFSLVWQAWRNYSALSKTYPLTD